MGFSADDSPLESYDDAQKYYEMVLDNAGKIAEEFIAPRAEEVDELGATLKDGVVSWAPRT